MSYSFLRLEREGAVARLTLDRPPVNALDIATMLEMSRALHEVEADPEVSVVLVTGEGKAFCAGVDVEDHSADQTEVMLDVFHGVVRQLMELPCPVVVAVNGAALGGGCELMLAADVVFARAGSKIGQPEILLGVFPPVAAALLPRLIGRQRAMDLILSGRTLNAEEALAMGLVSRVIPPNHFAAEVDEYVAGLASLSRPVLRLAKTTVRECLELSPQKAVDRAEQRYLRELMALEDPHEGLSAFLEKRSPVWKGA
ncbi:MAG: enoyl-CoA hydratase/isomerase family protein [Gemmatimonadetes bacterium]|nr:enoyl-CoA hydratase/isomerase family protein [Gemmatimonadota bacterium]